MANSSSVPSVPVRVDEKNIQNGAKDILKLVRPNWSAQNLRFKVFTEGLSNKLVGFFVDTNPEDMVIIKVFGTNTDFMIDRKAEIETMRLLHERKCGAELYATFENGICYEYVNGCTLEVSDCANPAVYPLVASEMAHMHGGLLENGHDDDDSHLPNGDNNAEGVKINATNDEYHHHQNGSSGDGIPNGTDAIPSIPTSSVVCPLWAKLEQLGALADECLEADSELRAKLELAPGWASGAIRELRNLLEPKGIPVTFCHNDLIPRNIVYDKKRRRVTFIDVEYAMPNYPAFDVANHFLEFAGLAEEMDYTKCPDKAFRLQWLEEYLGTLRRGGSSLGDVTVEQFNEWVELCIPASHLFWSLWGVYQARHSTIHFDYIKYVGTRVGEFQKCIRSLQQAAAAAESAAS